MGKLTFILGGARSGKSAYAQQLVRNSEKAGSGGVLFIATATAGDEEMQARIERHRKDRSSDWTTIEAPLEVGPVIMEHGHQYTFIIVDCLTLLISNHLMEHSKEMDEETTVGFILREVEDLILAAQAATADIIVVSNEVGMGLVPVNPLGREFRDLTGLVNQRLAQSADEVYFMIAGLPQAIKQSRD
jgi:adenosylcobinamide kinase/adenosylcobinamide-phosphate guanylyltransferase